MRSLSYRIGRVEGIDLYLHPTFLLLLAYTFAFNGGLPAALLTAAVFGCVLLHELGHALMARHYGIRTEDITLYPIGGVARLERMPRSAGPELLIALAGPAVNLVIAGGLFLGFELAPVGRSNVIGGLLAQLMVINLGLALFNLLPIFPMDGGRVLRALLSGPLGRLRATAVSAKIGQAIAIVGGLYFLITGEWMLTVLSAFIYMAAAAELRGVRAEESRRTSPGDFQSSSPPPGYQWVTRGDGIWTLAPIVIHQAGGSRTWR